MDTVVGASGQSLCVAGVVIRWSSKGRGGVRVVFVDVSRRGVDRAEGQPCRRRSVGS